MSEQTFRWQAFLQRSTEPLFLLNRQQYLLFVNRAFEELARQTAAQLRRLYCNRPDQARVGQSWKTVLKHVLTPPPEVLAGTAGRYRRLIPARTDRPACWWDVDFLPFLDRDGFRGVLGKIIPGPDLAEAETTQVSERVVNIRQRMLERLGRIYLGIRLPTLRRLAEQMRLASQSRFPVLLVGAPGTGKETVARLIHYRSPERERSFAAIDCRRLPAFAVGALLWGESGATARAALGTIYLKEPTYLPGEVQERLHRWLTTPHREDRPMPRVITGWHIEPAEAVRQGLFQEELYQALVTQRIDVPSLKERRDDLPHLVDRMLQRLNAEGGRAVLGLTPDVWEVLLSYSWPGNLRELYIVLQGARRHSQHDLLDASDLPAYIRQGVQLSQMPAVRAETPLPIRPLLHEVERRLIELALRRTGDHRRNAAKLLSVEVPWLYKRLNQLGLVEHETDEDAE
jgi:DNA-binding NtrC family response regulator